MDFPPLPAVFYKCNEIEVHVDGKRRGAEAGLPVVPEKAAVENEGKQS